MAPVRPKIEVILVTKENISRGLLTLIPFSLCFSQRLNALVLFLYLLSVLIQKDIPERFRFAVRQRWIYPFIGLYLIQAASLLWTADLAHGYAVLSTKAPVAVLPVLIAMDVSADRRSLRNAMWSLIAGCSLGLLYCIIFAVAGYFRSGETGGFFYHSLGDPLDRFNALYFSFYLFGSLVFLSHLGRGRSMLRFLKTSPKQDDTRNRNTPGFILGLFLTLGLVLLSSRLFLLLTIGFFVFQFLKNDRGGDWFRHKPAWILPVVLLAGSIYFTGFPRDRFLQIIRSDFAVLQQDRFSWDTPFNGLTLRLVLLKFGWQILGEKDAWLTGLGVGDVRGEMDAMIVRYNLYHGNPDLGDTGYLGYNFHNQYLELVGQSGIACLGCWLLALIMGFRYGRGSDLRGALVFLLAGIVCFSLIEGVLERQRGVVFIAFFMSLFFKCNDHGIKELSNGRDPG